MPRRLSPQAKGSKPHSPSRRSSSPGLFRDSGRGTSSPTTRSRARSEVSSLTSSAGLGGSQQPGYLQSTSASRARMLTKENIGSLLVNEALLFECALQTEKAIAEFVIRGLWKGVCCMSMYTVKQSRVVQFHFYFSEKEFTRDLQFKQEQREQIEESIGDIVGVQIIFTIFSHFCFLRFVHMFEIGLVVL